MTDQLISMVHSGSNGHFQAVKLISKRNPKFKFLFDVDSLTAELTKTTNQKNFHLITNPTNSLKVTPTNWVSNTFDFFMKQKLLTKMDFEYT